jgi:hypothetical protein
VGDEIPQRLKSMDTRHLPHGMQTGSLRVDKQIEHLVMVTAESTGPATAPVAADQRWLRVAAKEASGAPSQEDSI